MEGLALLGQLIRAGRIERKITAQELATRAGISRALLYRVEHGDPQCSIGAVFEAATIVGVLGWRSLNTHSGVRYLPSKSNWQ